jgi:geranylgeranyl pyrophosphate synthase
MSLYDRFVKVGFIDYDDYFELIRNTTAVFIQLPFFIASVINNDQEKKLQSMLDLGMLIGLSYQIRDDILDLVVIDESGTILQSDIQEKKIRLPLIHCIKNSNQIDKDIIINILKKDIINKENVIIIYNLLKKYQSIKYTIEVSEIILKKAENIINEYVNKDNQESFFEILKMLRGNINEYTFE